MKNKKILLGISGGVDSSVAALLLKKRGYSVIGCFLKNFSDTKNPITGECNWIEEKKIAQKICALLEIPFIMLDYEKQYKKEVIDPMFKDYSIGLTPNPDIACNTIIKFPALIKKAKELDCDLIATGHYAKIKKVKNKYSLYIPKDKSKDQTYFLYELTEKELSKTLFPLEKLTKGEVRKIAKENNFPNYNKVGSRGICFIGKVNMKKFLKNKIKQKFGKIVSPEGEIIGKHPGINYFTIHERIGPAKEIEIIDSYRNLTKSKLYVAEKRENNILVVAPENHKIFKKYKVYIEKLSLINKKEKIPKKIKGRIRHLGKLHSGNLIKRNRKYIFSLKKPLKDISPGQSIVFYANKKLIGGGKIISVK